MVIMRTRIRILLILCLDTNSVLRDKTHFYLFLFSSLFLFYANYCFPPEAHAGCELPGYLKQKGINVSCDLKI